MADQVQIVRWEEPPPPKTRTRPTSEGHSRYAPIAEQLRANPGRWAVVLEGRRGAGTALATHIRMGHMKCFTPAGDFEATMRAVNGRGLVYARYLGDGIQEGNQ
jgi:hypothetical protein